MHDKVLQCLGALKGEAVVHNIMLMMEWSSSTNKRLCLEGMAPHHDMHMGMGMGILPPPLPRHQNRLTVAKAADSTTLFLKLPPTLHFSA